MNRNPFLASIVLLMTLFFFPAVLGMDDSFERCLWYQLCDDSHINDISIVASEIEEALRYAVAQGGNCNNQKIITRLIENLEITDKNFEYTQQIFLSLVTHKTMVCAARLLAKRPDLVAYPPHQQHVYSDQIFFEYQNNSHTDELKAVYFYMLNICFEREPHFNQKVARALLPLLITDGAAEITNCCDLINTMISTLAANNVAISPIDIVPLKYIMYNSNNYTKEFTLVASAGAMYQNTLPQRVIEGFNKVILPLLKNKLLSQNAIVETFLEFLLTSIPPQSNLPLFRKGNMGIALQERFIAQCLNAIAEHIAQNTVFTDNQQDTLIRGFYKWIERISPEASCTVISLLLSKFPYLAAQPHCSWVTKGSSKKPQEPLTLPLAFVQQHYKNAPHQLKSQMLDIVQKHTVQTHISQQSLSFIAVTSQQPSSSLSPSLPNSSSCNQSGQWALGIHIPSDGHKNPTGNVTLKTNAIENANASQTFNPVINNDQGHKPDLSQKASSSPSSNNAGRWTLGISTDSDKNNTGVHKKELPTSSAPHTGWIRHKKTKSDKDTTGVVRLTPLFDEYDDEYESKSVSKASTSLPSNIPSSSSSSRNSESGWSFGLSQNPDTTTGTAAPNSTASPLPQNSVLINSSITVNRNQTPVDRNATPVTASKTYTKTSTSHDSSHSQSSSTSSSSVKFEATINAAPLAALTACIVIAGIVIKKWYSTKTHDDASKEDDTEIETQSV